MTDLKHDLERVARETAERCHKSLISSIRADIPPITVELWTKYILDALRQFEALPCGHARSELERGFGGAVKDYCRACVREQAKVEDARREGILIGNGLAEVEAGRFRPLKEIKEGLRMRSASTPGDTPSTMISLAEADARVQAAAVEMREAAAKEMENFDRELMEDWEGVKTRPRPVERIRALPTPTDALDALLAREWERGHADGLQNACSAAVASYIEERLAKAREEEREACAKTAFVVEPDGYRVAEAIRARGGKT